MIFIVDDGSYIHDFCYFAGTFFFLVLYTHIHTHPCQNLPFGTDQDYPLQSYYEHLVAIKRVSYGYSELRYIINVKPTLDVQAKKEKRILKKNINILILVASESDNGWAPFAINQLVRNSFALPEWGHG